MDGRVADWVFGRLSSQSLPFLEVAQLKQLKVELSPQLRRYGIGARLRRDEKGPRLSTVFMLDGVPCR